MRKWHNHNFDPRNFIGKAVIRDKNANRVIVQMTESIEERRAGKLYWRVAFVNGVTIG